MKDKLKFEIEKINNGFLLKYPDIITLKPEYYRTWSEIWIRISSFAESELWL